jgi:hypothetical protein
MSNSSYEIGKLVTSTRTLDVHSATRCGARSFRRAVSALSLSAEQARCEDCASTFADTSAVLAGLRHPHLVAIEDLWETGGRPWAVVPTLGGSPLAERLDVPASRARSLPLESAATLVLSLAEAAHALSDAHGGAALGGLSADSVWILPDGTPALLPTVRLTAASAAGPGFEDEGVTRYRAPEACGGEPPGASADVYALALLFWDLLALGRAHLPVNINGMTSATPARLDQGIVQLVMRSLSASPSDRPRGALEFHAELSRLTSPGHDCHDLAEDPATVEFGTVEILAAARPALPLLPHLVVMPAPVRAAGEPVRLRGVDPGRLEAIPTLAVGARSKQLRIVRGDGSVASLRLSGPARRWVVGRGHSADLVVCDPDVSREHFEIVEGPDGEYRLYDLGSKNGVFVNGAAADKVALRSGDEVRAGETLLRFEP